MKTKLSPCPFCGEAPETEPAHYAFFGANARVSCFNLDCPASIVTAEGRTLAIAARRWNTRAPIFAVTVTEVER